MSRDMAVLRKVYDKSKHELSTRKERMALLEQELDSLHTQNSKDDNFRGSYRIENGVFRKSTIMTADMGTERRDEVVNLDSLKSHILVQSSKLHYTQERL